MSSHAGESRLWFEISPDNTQNTTRNDEGAGMSRSDGGSVRVGEEEEPQQEDGEGRRAGEGAEGERGAGWGGVY